MIYKTPSANETTEALLAHLDELRGALGDSTGVTTPWLGRLRREWRASAAASSIEIEGFHVPIEETIGLSSGQQPADPNDEDRQALVCYVRAMDHVGVMSDDPQFRWVDRVTLDLHFDACYFQKDKRPGRYRVGPISVTSPRGNSLAYTGPPHEDVAGLMAEVTDWLAHGDQDEHVVVRAAMAHLHLVSVHPFEDGNGRVSRIVQSLVLARHGLLAPEFLSIEEYLGEHTDDYYAVLETVQGGSYQPDRDAKPWIEFCARAHVQQALRRSAQLKHAAKRWSFLEALVEQREWPDRLVVALEQSLFNGVDRARYVEETAVSQPTASGDLRRLRDAGLVVQEGSGRSTRYRASAKLSDEVRKLLGQPDIR
jgi:Fic family protein